MKNRRVVNRLSYSIMILFFVIILVFTQTNVIAESQEQKSLFSKVENITINSSGNLVHVIDQENARGEKPSSSKLLGVFSGVAADNSYAYVVNHVFYEGNPNVGLWIIDFLSPDGPIVKGFLNIDLANDLFVTSHYAYVVSGMFQWSPLLSIVDISNPSSPILVGTAELTAPGLDVFVDGNYAYVALDGRMGILQVVDVSNPSTPNVVGTYYNGYGSAGVAEHNNIVYLADEYGLITLDVTSPGSPSLISEYPTGIDDPVGIRLKQNIIYITTKSNSHVGALYILDVALPANPYLLSVYTMPEGNAHDIWLLGHYAFIANDVAGLRFMDLSDLNNPMTLDIYDTNDTAQDLAVCNNILYLADGSSLYMFELNLYSITGRVIDPNGSPMSDFPVYADGFSENATDQNGHYSLDGLYPGDYYVYANKPGYHSLSPDFLVHIPADNSVPDIIVDLNLINGRILAANTMPVSGIKVNSSDGNVVYSDELGRYSLIELPEQSYTITPNDANWVFQPDSFSFVIPPYIYHQNFWVLPPPQTVLLIPGVQSQITYQEVQGTVTTIQFPQDAVTITTTLVLTPTLANAGWDLKFTGHAFDMITSLSEKQISNFSFNAPIALTIEYSDFDLKTVTDESLLLIKWKGELGWEDAALTCDPPGSYSRYLSDNLISLPVCKTGLYGLFGPHHVVFLPSIHHSPWLYK